jgi:hypothetical protein
VDRDVRMIGSLDPADTRRFELAVAGPSALLVAKVHKILDRLNNPDRLSDKDALDVYRLLRAVSTEELRRRFVILLGEQVSRTATLRAIEELPGLFGSPTAAGSRMAVRAAGSPASAQTLAASLVVLAQDLATSLRSS